ncbi:MAG: glycine cleavage system aminomethyltransferase GcvT [Armatimonadetes bacterium]|nr:glycine cleavage system aminomethyltransferase GcvT [Armatimonadota bacterium]
MQEADALLRTPLYAAHVAARSKIVPFAGWEMPVQYAGVIAEVNAVRTGVGVFDVSHMGRVRVHGHDAEAFLNHLTANDVAKLTPGKAHYSLICTDAGGVVDDIIVYRLGASEFIVVVNASNRVKALAWFGTHRAGFPSLFIEDETFHTGLIAVQGAGAVAMCDALSDADLNGLPRFGITETVVAECPVMVARTGYTGEDGLELFCRDSDAETLWNTLVVRGAVCCGLGARDTLRVEAALPLYGHEMDERTNPFAARLAWVVKTEKPAAFVGQPILQTLKASPRDFVLVGVEMETRAVPRDGYVIFDDSGNIVGTVTSGTFSPTLGVGIALARVRAACGDVGTSVSVVIRDAKHAARIVPLPFYKRKATDA